MDKYKKLKCGVFFVTMSITTLTLLTIAAVQVNG